MARIAGVTDRDAAAALKGTKLHVSRSALPPAPDEEFYHADLIGLEAELADGSKVGRVTAVNDYGAGTVLDIARPASTGGGIVVVPFTRAVVPDIDLARGRLVLAPSPGLLDGPARPSGGEQGDPR